MTRRFEQEIACQQVLVEDNSVFSVQWSIVPAPLAAGISPHNLLQRYLTYIRRCTLSIIRPHLCCTGIEFRLLASKLSLISFLPPDEDDTSAVLRICGGLLVQPRQCDRGELRFEVTPRADGTKVLLQLSDFCPLILGSAHPSALRRWLYRLTQATIHRLVTVRFLMLLYRELAGPATRVRIVTVRMREGQPV